ncbi:MAG: biotin--[acetyl-CoA-carboxylase] ligase [Chitinophagaceae bacterium]|nr:biotin--[acetyl-CoA-carboxylase] ligase [Chitinophagaceae bacterium]
MPYPPDHKPLGLPFVELQSIDSTNNYARQQIHDELAQHGMTIFSHEQVAGKGQRGKTWSSEKGANIMMSVIVKPGPVRVDQQFQLNTCVAVAVHEFFSHYADGGTKIKWPNDLFWQDRKAGGVLIESIVGSRESGAGTWDWAIIGIGININQTAFPSHLPNPVSLTQITGKIFEPVKLAKQLCGVLEKNFTMLVKGGFEKIYATYLDHLYKKDTAVKFKKNNRVFEATIRSVSPSGKLIVQHAIEEEFDFGEIEWVM